MDRLTFVTGNKAYSSWSMRPWLALKQTGATFDEIVIPLYVPGYKEKLLAHSPAGKVPVLEHGARLIWDSLAICEYLAEQFPQAELWPRGADARSLARAVSAEMHAGFSTIRTLMPFNCRAEGRRIEFTPALRAEILRIQGMWSACRERFGAGGPWLFGRFSIADAMYVPVALRFVTYAAELDTVACAYLETVQAHAPVRDWIASAKRETAVIESSEVGKAD